MLQQRFLIGLCLGFLILGALIALRISKSENRQFDKSSTFSIMTYNVSAYSNEMSIESQHKLLRLIEREQPDILCFQELSFVNLGKIKPHLDSIYGSCNQLTGDDQLWRLRFYSHFPLRNFTRYKCSGLIDTIGFDNASKFAYEISKKQMNLMSAEFEIEQGKWVRIFSGHLRSSAYSTARRSMDKNLPWWNGIPIYWRNYQIGRRLRNYEAENARTFIDNSFDEEMPIILAGDLNDWSGSQCLRLLQGQCNPNKSKQLSDAWTEGGCGFGFTFFGMHLRLRLDHILYSDDLKLIDVEVVDSDISDHKPLIATFRLN